MTYRQQITAANTALAQDPRTVFLGYGITKSHALGTLKDVPAAQLIETPVAENLMAGLSTGFSLQGRIPVLYFERCDFILNALDGLLNHLTKIRALSLGQFAPAAIIRVIIGNRENGIFTGPTHTQDYSEGISLMLMDRSNAYDSWHLTDGADIANIYATAKANAERGVTTFIWEYKDRY